MLISDYLSSNLHSFFDLTHFRELGQKYKNISAQFLVQMKTSKFAFEINCMTFSTTIFKASILPSQEIHSFVYNCNGCKGCDCDYI